MAFCEFDKSEPKGGKNEGGKIIKKGTPEWDAKVRAIEMALLLKKKNSDDKGNNNQSNS